MPPCTAALFVRKSRAAAFRRCGNQPSVCAQCSDAAPKQAAAADAHTNCAACLSWLAFGTQARAHRMASAVTGSPFVYGAAPAWAWRRLNASCRRAGPGVTATASANASIARPGATISAHSWWAGLPGKTAPLYVSLFKGKMNSDSSAQNAKHHVAFIDFTQRGLRLLKC